MSPPFQPARGKITLASGPRHGTDSPVSDSLSLRLRDSDPLASPHTATRRFILQKTRRNARAPRHLEGPRFQVLFHSPRRGSFHLSLTVLCAIGSRPYLALDRGRPGFGQGFTCPALLRIPQETHSFRLRGSHALRHSFPEVSPTNEFSLNSSCGPTTPLMWFGLFPVRSPLLGESLLISVPELIRWFTSLSIAPVHYIFMHSGDIIADAGLLHSDIRGSKDMCSSPRLFAAYHVLLRLAAPRHPP